MLVHMALNPWSPTLPRVKIVYCNLPLVHSGKGLLIGFSESGSAVNSRPQANASVKAALESDSRKLSGKSQIPREMIRQTQLALPQLHLPTSWEIYKPHKGRLSGGMIDFFISVESAKEFHLTFTISRSHLHIKFYELPTQPPESFC